MFCSHLLHCVLFTDAFLHPQQRLVPHHVPVELVVPAPGGGGDGDGDGVEVRDGRTHHVACRGARALLLRRGPAARRGPGAHADRGHQRASKQQARIEGMRKKIVVIGSSSCYSSV